MIILIFTVEDTDTCLKQRSITSKKTIFLTFSATKTWNAYRWHSFSWNKISHKNTDWMICRLFYDAVSTAWIPIILCVGGHCLFECVMSWLFMLLGVTYGKRISIAAVHYHVYLACNRDKMLSDISSSPLQYRSVDIIWRSKIKTFYSVSC
jgi:hypothetical protein